MSWAAVTIQVDRLTLAGFGRTMEHMGDKIFSEQAVRDQVLAIIREHAIIGDSVALAEDTCLFASGMDSIAVMQLLVQLENHFGIQVDPAEVTMEHFGTVQNLTGLLRSKHYLGS